MTSFLVRTDSRRRQSLLAWCAMCVRLFPWRGQSQFSGGSFASSNVILQFRGGDLAVPYPPVQRTAVEYFPAGHGHYFATADVPEIATLDAAPASGWARTGQTFGVYAPGDLQLVPVCRFWSGQSHAPKSSHFYTP